MGIYYNRELVAKVPTQWETLSEILKKPETTADMPIVNLDKTLPAPAASPSTPAPPAEIPAFTNIGYGHATPSGADILALLIAQKK